MAERSDECSSDQDVESGPVEDLPLPVSPHRGEGQQLSTAQRRSGDTGRQVQGGIASNPASPSTSLPLVNRYGPGGFPGSIHIVEGDLEQTCISGKIQQIYIRLDNDAKPDGDEISPDNKVRPVDKVRPDNIVSPDNEVRVNNAVSGPDDKVRQDNEVIPDDVIRPDEAFLDDAAIRNFLFFPGIIMMDDVQTLATLLLFGLAPEPTALVDCNGLAALHWAASTGAVRMIHFLIKCGLDVNSGTNTGKTALHVAAHFGHQEAVSALVDAGCSIDLEDNEGLNALHWAALTGAVEMVSFLIKCGLNVSRGIKTCDNGLLHSSGVSARHWAYRGGAVEINLSLKEHGLYMNTINYTGRTALHTGETFSDDARLKMRYIYTLQYIQSIIGMGDVQTLIALLLCGAAPKPTALKDSNGCTALHWAAAGGAVEMIHFLIKCGLDVNRGNKMGRTALHLAACQGHQEVVTALVDAGCPIDVEDNTGLNALHFAAQGGVVEMVSFLVKCHLDVKKGNKLDNSPALHLATLKGHQEVVSTLVDAGCPIDVENSFGWNALHFAAWGDAVEIIHFLVDCGLDVNSRDKLGATALHFAAYQGHQEVVSALVAAGCPIDVEDNQGRNALHLAAFNDDVEMIFFLVKCGLDVNSRDKLGATALRFAAYQGHQEVVSALVDAGCPIDVEDSNGRNALHWAAEGGAVEMVPFLIKCGLDVNRGDKTGTTALHVAAKAGLQEVLSALVDAGCPIDVADNQGRNALHHTAINGDIEMVSFLIKCGLDVNKGTETGMTALHLAAESGHQEIVSALVNAGCPVDLKDSRNGRNALHYAAKGGAVELIKFLIEGEHSFDVNCTGKFDITPLHAACASSQPQAACELLKHGALLTKVAGPYGTPFHQSVLKENTSLFDDILTFLSTQSLSGSTAYNNYPESTNPLDVRDSFGRTPAFWAAERGCMVNLEKLVANNCDLRVRSNINFSLFEEAVRKGLVCQLQAIAQACGINTGRTNSKKLLHTLQDWALLDPKKLLILGAIGGGPRVIDLLTSEEDMFTAAAHQQWSYTYCKKLLDFDFRISKVGKDTINSLCPFSAHCSLTPLQIAIIFLRYRLGEYCEARDAALIIGIIQSMQFVQKLITHPVSKFTVNVQFHNGLSPLDVAQQFGLHGIADLIESAGGRPGMWADLPNVELVRSMEAYSSFKILQEANPAAVSRIMEQFSPQSAKERILGSKPQLKTVIKHIIPNLRHLGSWFEVGVQLGVSVDMLTAVEEEPHGAVQTAYRKMLTHWLEHGSQVSWESLFDALDSFETGKTVKEMRTKVLEELQSSAVTSPPTPASSALTTHGVPRNATALLTHKKEEALLPHQRLMDKYRDRLLKVVPAKELVLKWKNHKLVSDLVYHEIKPETVAPSTARDILFHYFWDHGTQQSFEKAFCQIMVEEGQEGYHQAAQLGRDMQADLMTQMSPHH